MKRLLKRLLVGLLLCPFLVNFALLSAFAQEVFGFQGGHGEGVALIEGKMPEDVISVVMPTATPGMFNFILDPNNLIKRTRATRYNGAKFGDGNLFFKNSAADGSVSYSMNSDSLTLINKSSCPLTVSMSLTVDKGDNEFDFADAPDFLDADSHKMEAPALYLALVCGADRAPVQEAEDEEGQTFFGADLETWVSAPDSAYYVLWDADKETYVYQIKPNIPDEAFSSVSVNMMGVINDADWEAFEGDIEISLVWDVAEPLKYEAGPAENPNPDALPLIAVVEYARAANKNAVLSLSYGFGANQTTQVTKMTYVTSAGAEKSVNVSTSRLATALTVSGQTATVKAAPEIFEGRDWKLVFASADGKTTYAIPFALRGSPTPDIEPDVTVEQWAEAEDDDVILTVDFGAGEREMTKVTSLVYTRLDTGLEEILTAGRDFTVSGSVVTIKAVRTVYEGLDWKLVLSNDSGETAAVAFDLRNPDIVIESAAPEVEVLTPATKVNDTVKINVTSFGKGAQTMSKVNRIVYTNLYGDEEQEVLIGFSASTLSMSGSTITVKAIKELFEAREWSLEFGNAGENVVLVPFTLRREDVQVEDVLPVVTVGTKANAVGAQVTLTVTSFGAGMTTMESISGLTYEDVYGQSQTLSLDDSRLSVTGSRAVVTLDKQIFEGSNWALTFSSGREDVDGVSVDVELRNPSVTINHADPTVTVNAKAKAVGDSVTLKVNYGSGNLSMDAVSALSFKTSAGSDQQIAVSNNGAVRVDGTTVTISATAEIFNGSDWNLVFTRINPSASVSVPFSLKADGGGGDFASVTVDTPAAAVKDVVKLTVSYAGDLTKVTKLTYKQKGKVAETVLNAGSAAFKVNDASVTIIATSDIYNGSNWRLTFASEDGKKTLEIPFNLKKAGAVEGAAVTVTKAASAVKDTVQATVDFGSSFTKVKSFSYKQKGKVAETVLNAGSAAFKVNDASVTIIATSDIYNGSSWKIVLANDDGSMTISVPINIKAVG